MSSFHEALSLTCRSQQDVCSTSSYTAETITMARLWQDLPTAVLEVVLANVPAHDLCRFRLVCKEWNHLITQPSLSPLWAEAPWQASYVLITPLLIHCSPIRTWRFLNMGEKRIYPFSDSFIKDHVLRCGNHHLLLKYTLAADGGLIYTAYLDSTGLQHMVCNPVSKSFHHITPPQLERYSSHPDIVVMSVDRATQNYKIIIIDDYKSTTSRRAKVQLYDSTTKHWGILCEAPGNGYAYSSIILRGVLYTLFLETSQVPSCCKLYSCDLESGAWSYIDVALPQPSHFQDMSKLIVSLGRLFFVQYTGLPSFPFDCMDGAYRVEKKKLIDVSIWEILLAQKEVTMVARMPKFSWYSKKMFYYSMVGEPIVPLGCGSSIVILSVVGRCVEFDLLKKRWHDLPTNTVGESVDDSEGLFGCGVHLDLRTMKT